MNLDTKQMQYLVKLAEVRNFTQAARELYVSQPSLSAFVSRVEAELGIRIFDRSTSPMTLTEAGSIYIEELRQICGQFNETNERMREIIRENIGELKVGFPVERGAAMLPYILPAYKKLYPNIEVKISSVSVKEMLEAIDEKRIAMGIIPSTEVTTRMNCDEIYEEEVFLVDGCGFIREMHLTGDESGGAECPNPGSSAAGRAGSFDAASNAAGAGKAAFGRVDISKLDGLPLIALKNSHAIRIFTEELLGRYGVKPRLVMEAPSNIAAYRLAAAGMGVAIVPALTVKLTKKMGDARLYRLSSEGTFWKVMAISARDVHMSAVERDFILCMREVMQREMQR